MIQENTPICQEEELHPEAIRQVREKLPQDEVLYDLAELFKIFGDSTRVKILYALLEAEDVPFLPDGRVDWKALRERQKNA